MVKVSKGAKIRNRYNQVPHLTQDTNGKVRSLQLDTTTERTEVSPFPAGDHKAKKTSFRRGSNIFQGGGGGVKLFPEGSNCLFPIERHITCDFPGGGSGPPVPPLDPHLRHHKQEPRGQPFPCR